MNLAYEARSAAALFFRPLRLIAWRLRWIRWWIAGPGYRLGDPSLGRGELRDQNRALLKKRYAEREPRRPA